MTIEDLSKDNISKLTESNHSVVLFYANGCNFCETAKEYFQDIQIQYPNVRIFKAEINEFKELYNEHAELIPSVMYAPSFNVEGLPEIDLDGNQITEEIQELNLDGTVKMVPKYSFPSFYVYAKEEVSETNPYGWVGAFDGANPSEAYAVIEQLSLISG